jgi:hypothetical protein
LSKTKRGLAVHLSKSLPTFCGDAATVILLRLARIFGGGRTGMAEAELMVTEKVAALLHVQAALWSGAYGSTPGSIIEGVAAHYARGVRANRRRLSKR